MATFSTRRTRSAGFTLVEILIVVIILGILAAIAIPQFSTASADSRRNSAMGQLKILREQIQLFRAQHNDVLPDLVGQQWNQLQNTTNLTGAIDPSAAGIFGPYIPKVPANPINSYSTVAASPAIGVGWVYDAATGVLQATNQTPTLLFDDNTGLVQ